MSHRTLSPSPPAPQRRLRNARERRHELRRLQAELADLQAERDATKGWETLPNPAPLSTVAYVVCKTRERGDLEAKIRAAQPFVTGAGRE